MGQEGGFGWCNLIIKFLLFVTNLIIWILGMALLAIGIYVQVETAFDGLELNDLITNPSIGMIIIGSVLFIIGFCGCLGALLEIFVLLLVYCIILGLVLIGEIALVVYFVLQQDQAYMQFENLLATQIESYYDNIDLRNLIDGIQMNFFRCCGIRGPDDWQKNIYFNCSSIAFQRCSVPFSCCMLEDGDVVNVQCGYRRLDPDDAERFNQEIYTTGCLTRVQELINGNLYTVIGVGVGLLIFQVLTVLLAGGLAYDVYREKKAIRHIKNLQKQKNKDGTQMAKL